MSVSAAGGLAGEAWQRARRDAERALGLLDYELAVLRAHHEGYHRIPRRMVAMLERAIADARIDAAPLVCSLDAHRVPPPRRGLGCEARAFRHQITLPALTLVAELAEPLRGAVSFKGFPGGRRDEAEAQLRRLCNLDTTASVRQLAAHVRRPERRFWLLLGSEARMTAGTGVA